jgi:hypothetical protein
MNGLVWVMLAATLVASCTALAVALSAHVKIGEIRSAIPDHDFSYGDGLAAPGTPIGAFSARTTQGDALSEAEFSGPDRRLLAAFTVGCSSCTDELDRLRDAVDTLPVIGPPIALIAYDEDIAPELRQDHRTMVATLGEFATVVTEPSGGPLRAAMKANAFPAFYLVREGAVELTAGSTRGLVEQLSMVGTD